MKKVALITFHDTTNFGALLQTFGLYKKLNDLGFDCYILDYKCANIIKREIPGKFSFSFNPKKIAIELLLKPQFRRRYANMCMFVKLNMFKMTDSYTRETINDVKEIFDIYIAGSDMLWGLDITDGDYSYFLDFVDDKIKKVSYATSIGKREWNIEELEIIQKLLNRFDAISVREETTAQKLLAMGINKCNVVCDPTMLIMPDEWKQYVSNKYKRGHYVLVYFDSDEGKALRDAKTYAKKNNKDLLFISPKPSFLTGARNVFPEQVEDFLSLVYYADMVFTASYHGLLFSLYYHKNFVYYNRQPSYRMQTVASRLKIEDREGHVADIDNLSPLDYAEIDKRMNDYRMDSVAFLVNALE